MEPVSDRWAAALAGAPSFRTQCTITAPGKSAVAVQLEQKGQLQVSRARIRRKMTGLALLGDREVYDLAATPGAVVRILDGLYYGSGAPELVPIITGTVQAPSRRAGAGSTGLTVVDFGQWLSETRFRVPFVGTAGTKRVDVIAAAVTTARPGTVVVNTSSDVGTLALDTVWTESPLDVVDDLTTDGGTDGHFATDGTFQIVDLPDPSAAPVARIKAGRGGTLEAVERMSAQDTLYNGVIVRRSPTNTAQTWEQQEVWVTDLTDPRHPDHIGYRPYFVTAPTAASAAAAMSIARQRLVAILRPQEQAKLTAIANPALDVDDPVSVVSAAVGADPSDGFIHFIDSISLDLTDRSMDVETISQAVLSV